MAMHEKQDTYNKVITIISQTLNIDKNTISPESSLEGLGADSLDMLEIIMKLEETFNIEISDEEAEKVTTIQDAIEKIEKLRKK